MRTKLTELFSFTRSERRGSVVLMCIVFILLVTLCIQRYVRSLHHHEIPFSQSWTFFPDSLTPDDSLDVAKDRAFAGDATPHSVFHKHDLFPFDPNGLPEDDWVRLGLSPSQARVVKKYEAKGGRFRSKEDVKKLFVISDEFYREIEPYIVLPGEETQPAGNPGTAPIAIVPKKAELIELNTADTAQLISLKGIGATLALRIVEYRSKLGGFHSSDQLKEVFGITPETFSMIVPSLKLDTTYIRKINVNTADVKTFRTHPYFNPALANALVNYRKVHGSFAKITDIRNCALVNADLYRKIAPYLTL